MQHINLTLIDPNPWQPRKHMDPAGIEELAADIATRQANRPETSGLLQVPAARIVDANGIPLETTNVDIVNQEAGVRFQLAYGHRRHAAFALLAKKVKDWPQNMPLEIVTFSDEEMASAAWSENMARKDLTAIEEAEFIARFMDNFNLSHKVAAERLAMSRPTLSNRLRLLKLPKDIRAAVNAGTMPERTALALLPLYDLPEERVKAYEAEAQNWQTKPSEVIEGALAGKDSDKVRSDVTRVIHALTWEIEDWLPLDHPFVLVEGMVQSTCEGCPNLIRGTNGNHCLQRTCLELKEEAWPASAVQMAAEATGIPAEDSRRYGEEFTLWDWRDGGAEEIRTMVAGMVCDQRRLSFTDGNDDELLLNAKAYPGVRLVCQKKGGCTCLEAAKDAYLAEAFTPEELAAREAAEAKKTQAEKDREAKAREANKDYLKKQREREEAERKVRKELLEPVTKQLAGLLAKGDLTALKTLTRQEWELRTQSVASLKASTKKYKDAADVWERLAEDVVKGCASYSSLHSMTATRKALEKLLGLGLAIELPAIGEKPAKAKKKGTGRGKQKKAAA